MEPASLDDFRAINDQLAALVRADVPLEIGLGRSEKDVERRLETINATVARRVSRGESLTDALDRDLDIAPVQYRNLMQLGLRGGNFHTTVGGSQSLAKSIDNSRYALRSAFFYPLIICVLAYIGFVGFCLFFVPTVEGMFESLRITPGPGLRFLIWLRDLLPYWVAVPPILLLILLAARAFHIARYQAGAASATPWLPGMSRAIFDERCANFAEALAALLERGVSFEESLPLSAGASGDPNLSRGASSLADALAQGTLPSDESAAALRFPPFLRWTLWHSESTTGRARALRMAADVYRNSAVRRAERWRIVAPILACVIIGGGITLLYGLALFVPVVELIRAVANPS